MSIILPYMIRSGEQHHITESYVSVPPALIITDETGTIWTLGFKSGEAPDGEFAFNVLRDGIETGEVASRIERRNNRIRIFTRQGWKWIKTTTLDNIRVIGIGARMKSVSKSSSLINVSVWFEKQFSKPVVAFGFNSLVGGVEDLSKLPIQCSPGQWLCATVEPTITDVEVMAYLGRKVMRTIPIINLVSVEDS